MQPEPASASPVPRDVPESFFRGIGPILPTNPIGGGVPTRPNAPMKALILYDVIIDDILTHPDAKFYETAQRLGKSPNTISLIVRSDFFRARWQQRRERFSEDLNFRLQSKIAAVAEKALETTLDVLELKGTNIPLPILNDMNKTLLDRLGYGPSRSDSAPTVVVNNNAQAGVVNAQASPEGLVKAREYLKILEASNAASGARPGNASAVGNPETDGAAGPVVEGEAHRVEP